MPARAAASRGWGSAGGGAGYERAPRAAQNVFTQAGLRKGVPLRPLDRAFYARDADVVARDLLGRLLVRETARGEALAARIVETEAYFGPPHSNPSLARRRDLDRAVRDEIVEKGDPASHAFPGVTPRNGVMYGPPGRAYVYLCYGMHTMLNVVTGAEGDPQAVLLRAAEAAPPLPPRAATGPGRLARAFGVTLAETGNDFAAPPLYVAGPAPRGREIAAGPRVGIRKATRLPLRFHLLGSLAVSSWRPGKPRGARVARNA
jgi:DNA-3-methyladenine glycosylase